MPPKEELEEADKSSAILMLIKGKRKGGGPFYAYLAVPPSKILAFKAAEAKGNYMLDDYGEILAYGDEAEPPADVVKEMQEKYGADEDFEQKVLEAVKKAAAEEEFKNKQKEKDEALKKKLEELKRKKAEEE